MGVAGGEDWTKRDKRQFPYFEQDGVYCRQVIDKAATWRLRHSVEAIDE